MTIVIFQQLTADELDAMLAAEAKGTADCDKHPRLVVEGLIDGNGRLTDQGRSVLSTRSC